MREKIILGFIFFALLLTISVFAAQINSSSYKQTVVVSSGGENLSSSSYKMGISVGTISGSINSSSYNNKLGFFQAVAIDTIPPNITLNFPPNDFNTSVDIINFNWTVNDTDPNLYCNLTINGKVNGTNISSSNKEATNFTVSGLAGGANFWNVTCIDNTFNINTSITRNFTVVKGPSSLNATLAADNESIILDWEDLGYADSYRIYIIGNFTDSFQSTANVSGITDTNYTDSNAANKTARFYKIATVKGSVNKTSTKILGKYEFELINNSNAVTDWNLISLPLNITNFRLNNASNNGIDLAVKPLGCIKSLWFYNATIGQFMRTDYNGSAWIPAAGSENFTSLEPGRGYWVEVNLTCNLTFVGEVPTSNITVNLTTGWNVVGWYSPNSSLLPTSYRPSDPIVVYPANSVKAMDRYNPRTDLWEVIIHFKVGNRDWGWWPSANNRDFTYVDTTRGYYFDVLNNATWIYKPNTNKD